MAAGRSVVNLATNHLAGAAAPKQKKKTKKITKTRSDPIRFDPLFGSKCARLCE